MVGLQSFFLIFLSLSFIFIYFTRGSIGSIFFAHKQAAADAEAQNLRRAHAEELSLMRATLTKSQEGAASQEQGLRRKLKKYKKAISVLTRQAAAAKNRQLFLQEAMARHLFYHFLFSYPLG